MFSCQNGQSANQYFSLSKTNQLRRENTCAIISDSNLIVLSNCDSSNQTQQWIHIKVIEYVYD